ncbi:GDP-L-fucose synthase [Alphaproteobacteria bacterium]|nr:GDP-L-fucose synthase [Alphaproteobacteria bacterium]
MKKIFVAGHNGMVGSAICRLLESRENLKIITRTRSELDLCNQESVKNFMNLERPDEVIIAAAKVGGIHANNAYPADFIYENLQIQTNIIHMAHINNVQKLLFLGSSCIYPKLAKQPMKEDALLTGTLEPTNEPYAIAKISGIKLCESYNRQYGRDYRSVMPTNLYGPGDNYHSENSHVVPALIKRFHEAKTNGQKKVIVWGTGTPRREFLFVNDMAAASIFVHELDQQTFENNTQKMQSHINIGTGIDVTIKELVQSVKEVVGYDGNVIFDSKRPDGSLRKLMNIDLLKKLGWKAKINLRSGLSISYTDYLLKHISSKDNKL